MKKGRFLWSAHRITEKQKAGKARNIKEKQLKNSRNTVSKQLVALRSSANDNSNRIRKFIKTPESLDFPGFFLCLKFLKFYKKWWILKRSTQICLTDLEKLAKMRTISYVSYRSQYKTNRLDE